MTQILLFEVIGRSSIRILIFRLISNKPIIFSLISVFSIRLLLIVVLATRYLFCNIINRDLIQITPLILIFMETITLIFVFVLVFTIHSLLFQFIRTGLFSSNARFVCVIGIDILFFKGSSPLRPIVIVVKRIAVLSEQGIMRIAFPVGCGSILLSCISVFVVCLVRLLVFFHNGKYFLVHPVLPIVESECGIVWFFVHFSIKIMTANKLQQKNNWRQIITAIVNFYYTARPLQNQFTLEMNEHTLLQHIKTELSENEKEQNTTKDINLNSFHHQSHFSSSKYVCSICSKVRLTCPCPLANPSVSSFAYKLPLNINHRNQRLYLNKVANQNLTISVPKITFSYADPKQIRNRRNSLNITSSTLNTTQYQLTSVTTTTHVAPVEEIIYYPVIHNRIRYETPEKIVKLKERKEQSKTNKRRMRSYLSGYSSKLAKEASTRESKQPMTPEQFRKLTDWLMNQR